MQYKFRKTFRGSRTVDAETIISELERLRAEGELTASRVVEEAEPETAPLHPAFEWDDATAGEQYRLIQARQLIRAVVVVNDGDEEPESVYVHVPDEAEREGKYVLLAEASDDEAEFARALTEAQRRLTAAEKAFTELRQLVEGKGGRKEALAIAIQGFDTVREAIALLK